MRIFKIGVTKLKGHPVPQGESKRAKRRKAKEERSAEVESKRQRAAQRTEHKKREAHKKAKTKEAIEAWKRTKELDTQMDLAIDNDD